MEVGGIAFSIHSSSSNFLKKIYLSLFGQRLAIEYNGVEGPAASKIMGESYHRDKVSDDDRYTERFTFIVGLDYRIHPSSEELCVTVKKPPLEGTVPIKPLADGEMSIQIQNH